MDNIIHPNYIELQSTALTQTGIFQSIADIAVKNGIATSSEEVIKGLQAREEQSTTGLLDGFAIPHTQSDTVNRSAIVIVRTETGVEWESFDNEPAFFFIALLIPKSEAGTTHLQALSALSRVLMDEDKRQNLLDAKTNEALSTLIENAIKPQEDN